MEQTVKIIFIALASLLLHLAVLQLRFDSGPVHSANQTATEVGLVQFSSQQKPTSNSSQFKKSELSQIPSSLKKTSLSNNLKPETLEIPPSKSETAATPRKIEIDPSDLIVKHINISEVREQGRPAVEQIDSIDQSLDRGETADDDANHAAEIPVDKSLINKLLGEEISSIDEPSKPDSQPGGNVYSGPPVEALKLDVQEKSFAIREETVTLAGPQAKTGIQKAIPRYEINPRPVYPDIALRKGWEGITQLRVKVKINGYVDQVVIKDSSGFRALDRAALKAVRRWQFVPAMSAGFPVAGTVIVPINFDLQ